MVSPTTTLAVAAAKASSSDTTVRKLLDAICVRQAFRFFEQHAAEITAEHAAICFVPASPFGEEQRAHYLCERFRQNALSEAYTDKEGNCVALRRGRSLRPLMVVSAHLDTVFPAGTDFTVHQEQWKLRAPGIADDGCGLAALIALQQALQACRIETEGSLLFVGTVGEEGAGDLRGARHLLLHGEWSGKVDAFISLDGPGIERITHIALGSRRYRVRYTGTGGHSWGDFGTANPVHAVGRAIARLATYPAPTRPRTTFNVGRVEGGAGVNVIAREAMIEVDLRSESAEELRRLDAFFRRAVREAVDDENAACQASSSSLPLTIDLQLIGDRPSGETPRITPLVRLTEAATRAFGYTPSLECSSTDSNIAISQGIPAITIGAGGASGNSHTLDEWYDPRGRDIGLKRALLVTLGTVGLANCD